jgi:hypothetical protein
LKTRFCIDFLIDLQHNIIIFELTRKEWVESSSAHPTNQSLITICKYCLNLARDHVGTWYIDWGYVQTYGQSPQHGFWNGLNSADNAYQKQGLGKLFWHLAVWAAAALNIRREVLAAAPETQKWLKEYADDAISNEFEVLVQKTSLSNGEVLTTEFLIPSSNLSKYALTLAKRQIKTITANLLKLENKRRVQQNDLGLLL